MPDDAELLPVPDRRLKGDRLPLPRKPSRKRLSCSRLPIAVPRRRRRRRASAERTVAPTIQRAAQTVATGRAPTPAPEIAPRRRGRPAFADSLAVGIGFTREEADPAFLMARLYFGGAPMGETLEQVQPWQQGEAPNVETLTVSVDPEVTSRCARARSDAALSGRRPPSACPAARPSPARARSPAKAASDVAGRAARSRRVDPRQAGEVPRRGDLFRSRAASRCAARSRSRR